MIMNVILSVLLDKGSKLFNDNFERKWGVTEHYALLGM